MENFNYIKLQLLGQIPERVLFTNYTHKLFKDKTNDQFLGLPKAKAIYFISWQYMIIYFAGVIISILHA